MSTPTNHPQQPPVDEDEEFGSPAQIYLTLALILVPVLYFLYKNVLSAVLPKGDTILFTGNMSTGKTALFYQLKQGLFRPTYTSMKENDATFVPKDLEAEIQTPRRFVDLPGHASLRNRVSEFLSHTRAIVFCFDASSCINILTHTNHTHTEKAVSEEDAQALRTFNQAVQFLFQILIDASTKKKKLPILIVLTKVDKVKQELDLEFIREKIEKQLDKCRALQSSMSDLGSKDESGQIHTLGIEGEPFKFEHIANSVDIDKLNVTDHDQVKETVLEFVKQYMS